MTGEPFEVAGSGAIGAVPIVATAVHAGHQLRDEVRDRMVLDEVTRRREEDPFTDVVARGFAAHAVVHRSRFEVDLNRARDEAVYRRPDDCWGLEVWDGDLPPDLVERSRRVHDDFYEAMATVLDPLAEAGPFVVLDVHSYNHRRTGPGAAPEPQGANPEVNVGTGSMDRDRFAPVVDRFVADLRSRDVGHGPLDVRENVRFRGAHVARWVHERYPGTGCAIAVELKKTFMDEWTGEVDGAHLAGLRDALVATTPALLAGLDEVVAPEPGPVIATELSPADLAVDHALAQVAESFRFLLDVTPVRDHAERRRFLGGAVDEPRLAYRDLEVDPEVLAEQLAAVDLAGVEDPALGGILRSKHRELGLQVEMLRARGTSAFLPLSIELYGTVGPGLLETAQSILARLPADTPEAEPPLDARRFAALAQAEVDRYRSVDPDAGLHVEVRPDAIGIMVAGSTLLVSPSARVAASRADALVQHEVGTHLLTHANGARQPVRVLASGLAGYDETQEGLGVLAEILTGGLPPSRLRQLAARVVAVDLVVGGAPFGEVHRELVGLGLSPTSAYTATVRCVRSGGLTKDAIYLRGLLALVDHVARGGELGLLLVGKLSLDDLPLVADFVQRGVVEPPRLVPTYLDGPGALERLEQVRATTDLVELTRRTP